MLLLKLLNAQFPLSSPDLNDPLKDPEVVLGAPNFKELDLQRSLDKFSEIRFL